MTNELAPVNVTVEEVVLLAPDGEPIGTADKQTVHNANTPYHLAFSCYAFDNRDRLLVTRRSMNKRTWPGVWTNTCCGHPAPGENLTDAVGRRMRFELGLVPHELVVALPTFTYRAEANGVVEHELCPVLLCRVATDPTPNPDEVADWAWWTWDRLAAAAGPGDDIEISPWTRLQASDLARGGHIRRFLLRAPVQRVHPSSR